MQTSSVIDPQEPLAPRSGTRPWIVAGVIVVSAWLLWAFALTPSAARSPDRLGHDGAIQTFDSASAEHSQAKTEASAPAAPERRALAASASSPDSTSIRGHVVAAETGAPLARANVHLGTEVATERGDAPANWTQPADVVTGDDGLFTFAFVPPATLRFHLDVDGSKRLRRSYWWPSLRTGIVVDVGDVTMTLAAPLQLVVVDERDRAWKDVLVYLRFGNDSHTQSWGPDDNPTTDVSGVASWRCLPLGHWTYTIETPVRDTGVFELPAEPTPFTHRIVLRRPPPALTISGTVVDTRGAPIPDLELEIPLDRGIWAVRTDANGEFLRSVNGPLEGNPRFRIRLPSSRLDLDLIDDGGEFTWGKNDLRLVVRRRQLASLELEVVDAATGAPMTEYGACCHPDIWRLHVGGLNLFRSVASATHPQGITRFADLAPGPYRVSVFPPAPFAEQGELPIDLAEGQDMRLHVAIERPATLRVEVVDTGSQQPMPGVDVSLAKVVPEPHLANVTIETFRVLRRGGGISSGTNVLVLDRATTGDDGSGVLHAAPDTPALVVIAEGDHCVATMVRDVKLPRAGNSLRVEVAAACILRGTVRPLTFVRRFGPSEEVLAIDAVSLPNATRFAYQYPTIDLRRIGEQQPAATTRLKADGTFQFVAIPPGSYEVWLGPIASSGKASAVSSVDLRAGETKSIDVDVSQYVPGHLVGHFFVDGTAWQGEVDFHLIDGRTNQALTDASGTATSTWLLPGRYLPCAVVQEGDFGRYILGTEPIVLAPGAQLEFTAMLHRRRVVVTMHYSDDQPVASRLFVLEPLDHPEFAFSFQYGNRTNEHGELILDPAPPGRLRIRAFAADQDMFKDTPALVLGEVSADATELTLQLPR